MPKKIVDHKQPKPNYGSQTRGLAREAQVLERLLWLKIMATATPEIKELLLARTGLMHLTEDILEATGPRDFYPSPEVAHECLLEQVQKAQSFLIGTDTTTAKGQ
jgi:hypothetical protein